LFRGLVCGEEFLGVFGVDFIGDDEVDMW